MLWKQIVGGVILISLAAWMVVDYQGTTQVISSGAGGFNTAVRALEPPQASTGSLQAGAG